MNRASGELVKRLKKQKRENDFLLFLDNQKIIKDAIFQGAKPILALATKEELFPSFECDKYLSSIEVIEALSDVKTPRGVVVMLEYTQHVVKAPKSNFLVMDGIQDPGNAGTLIRSALAFGMESVFIIDGVKPTNSKLIRSSAGAVFNIPVYSMSRAEFIELVRSHNLKLAKTDMKGENVFTYEAKHPLGIVIGNEGQGVSDEISKICSVCLTIPMHEGIESLNAAVSGSIIMSMLSAKQV